MMGMEGYGDGVKGRPRTILLLILRMRQEEGNKRGWDKQEAGVEKRPAMIAYLGI